VGIRFPWQRTTLADAPVAELVAGARRGDRRAFEALYERYGRVVHALLLARVPPSDADDLTQEVFLTAIEKLDSLTEDAAFGGWICTIARNRARDHHRGRKVVVPLDPAMGRPPPPVVEAREVLAVIRSLPEAYAEILIMRLVGGLTGPEIAARTGMTHGSVRVNLTRGMKRLREAMDAPATTRRKR